MNKSLFNYCKDNLHGVTAGKLKITASLKRLNRDYGFGRLDDRFCYFTENDKELLIDRVRYDLNVHLFRDSYPVQQSRTQNAHTYRNEKTGALKVSEGFVLVNSLNSLCLNQHISENSPLSSLGRFMDASEIQSIQHEHIILVENLAVMANLPRLVIPSALQNALWLYRGDQEKHKQTGAANSFFKRFKHTHSLICFSDFDPKGLEIALTCGAEQWLTVKQKQDLSIKLSGVENEWFNQTSSRKYLNKRADLNQSIASLFSAMNINQKTLKQEHIIEHSLPLALYPLH